MTPSSISSIRGTVAQARAALLGSGADPAAVLPVLEAAAVQFREMQASLSADLAQPAALRAELRALRSDLAGVLKLAGNGEVFWRGWGRILGLEPGYTPSGLLEAEPAQSRIEVQG